MLVDHVMCRGGKLEESLLEQRAVRSFAARLSHVTVLGKFLKSAKERALHLDEDVEINDARVVCHNDCFVQGVQHHHGSQLLAVVMDLWLSFSRFGSNRQRRNHPHVKVFILIFAYSVDALVRVAGIEPARYCPIACDTSPMTFDRDRSLRNVRIFQERGPRWVSPHGPELFSSQQPFAPAHI